MKRLKIKISKTIFLITLLSLPIAINAQKKHHGGVSYEGSQDVKQAQINFKKNTIIEVAFVSIEGGKEGQIGLEYFPKILPIAAKYGGKMLGSLQVTAVTGGDIQPQMIAFFEWPNLNAREKLLTDKNAKKLFPIRDNAITAFKQAYYTVDKDVTVTFKNEKTYEFFNAWLTPESKTSLPKYFEKTNAVKKKYGPPVFLVSLKPLESAPNTSHVLHPHMTGIVEWDNTNTYYGLIADPEFKKHEHLLENSLSRIDMIHATFNFLQ